LNIEKQFHEILTRENNMRKVAGASILKCDTISTIL